MLQQMKRRYASLEWLTQLMDILIISSFPAILFGFFFGEVMGWIHPVYLLGVT